MRCLAAAVSGAACASKLAEAHMAGWSLSLIHDMKNKPASMRSISTQERRPDLVGFPAAYSRTFALVS